MYQSRLHATNGILSLAVDAANGEVLEFTRESAWDNAAKNHVRPTWSLFDAIVHTDQGDKRLHVPRFLDYRDDASVHPRVSVDQRAHSAVVTLAYPKLILGNAPAALSATITIELPENDCRTKWHMTLCNDTNYEVGTVNFPALDGLWLGESWEDDVLVLPRFAGWKVVNPSKKLAATPVTIHHQWAEYLYGYQLNEMTGTKDDRGAYAKVMPYAGEASMLWMDLYDEGENTGIYMTCRASGTHMMGLRAESFGETYPGAGLAIVHEPCLRKGTWESEECVVAFHEGDWHWAADEYRAWFRSVHPAVAPTHRPEWVTKSAGLMAHYDFQYQHGGIVHKYCDIPKLYDYAKAVGMNHLLLSGWNRDGFDYGFPRYDTNPLLGTEQELKDALAAVKAQGGHTAFYVNSRLCNTAFPEQQENIEKNAVRNRDGSYFAEAYGAPGVTFASMCVNTQWRHDIHQVVNYLTHDIGADSMYLDQLAMARAVKCYDESHDHGADRTAWNEGYLHLLQELIADYDKDGMALIYEGCNDVFGPYSSLQLITTLGGPFIGRFPELYRYTFPEQLLTDMMNPRRNSAMRAEHVARHSTEFLYKAFVCGMYFWCYDLEWDNTWRRDPEQHARLTKIVALRKAWLNRCGAGLFRDTVGLLSTPADSMVKRYDLDNGTLLAAATDSGTLCGEITIAWPHPTATAEVLTYDDPTPQPLSCTIQNGALTVTLPTTEAAVLRILP